MPQPPLDPIPRHCVADRLGYHETHQDPIVGTQACKTKVGRLTRTPDRMVRWKSAERVIRAFLGSTGVVDRFQAESLARPLRRRAATMARPARVRIRRRKPCVRLRRRLLGWNVRLLTGKLPQLAGDGLGWRLQESALDAGAAATF